MSMAVLKTSAGDEQLRQVELAGLEAVARRGDPRREPGWITSRGGGRRRAPFDQSSARCLARSSRAALIWR